VLVDASGEELRAGGGLRLSFDEPGQGESKGRAQIEAEDLVWNRIAQRAECAGQVVLRRAGARLSTDRLIVEGIGQEALRGIHARGQVSFTSAEWEGEGDRLEYSSTDGIYRLIGESRDAEARNIAGGGRLRGRALEIDAGGSAAAAVAGPGGRVTVRTATSAEERK
jgi:lipopolysaccharide export system protein LptA